MIRLPKDEIYILNKIKEANFKAYCVGGGVRDLLLGLKPKDYDFTTDATPNQIKEIFKDLYYLDVGEKYGTITVKYRSKFYEITTFRKDINYSDHRRPDCVIFSSDLFEDLSRRDFTINALAYNIEEGLIDYYDGLTDLNNKIIRSVGNPLVRFEEDALRIMRAIRFAVTYDFTIEEKTFEAMETLKNNLLMISYERLQNEFFKILLNITAKEWVLYESFFIVFIPELKEHQYTDSQLMLIENLDKDIPQRLAILLQDFAYETSNILKRLKCSNKLVYEVVKLINYLSIDLPNNKVEIKYILKELEIDLFKKLLSIRKTQAQVSNDLRSYNKILKTYELLSIIEEKKEPYSIKELDVKGRDLLNVGFKKGPLIKDILNQLLDIVIHDSSKNDFNYLLNYAKNNFL